MSNSLKDDAGPMTRQANKQELSLRAQGLACQRGGRLVFAGIGINLDAGEGLLLEGANGSGKTSLLRALAGLVPLSEGKARLAGGEEEASLAEQAHYVAHADATKAQLTVAENLAFWTDYLGGGDVRRGLAAFALEELADLPAAFLSAGQKRKLSLSRLAAVARPLWLLDEPSVSLDAAARDVLSAMMRDHMARGGILIAATHLDLGVSFSQRLNMSGART